VPQKSILVVDDEPAVLATTARIVGRLKRFKVLEACGYEEAFRKIAAHDQEVDVAILDIALEGKNGIELANDLQILYPQVKILFVSGLTGAEILNYSAAYLTDRTFLSKPFTSSQLRRRLEEILSKQAAPKTLAAGSSVPM
jgi:CheY-like chemotaxis protein